MDTFDINTWPATQDEVDAIIARLREIGVADDVIPEAIKSIVQHLASFVREHADFQETARIARELSSALERVWHLNPDDRAGRIVIEQLQDSLAGFALVFPDARVAPASNGKRGPKSKLHREKDLVFALSIVVSGAREWRGGRRGAQTEIDWKCAELCVAPLKRLGLWRKFDAAAGPDAAVDHMKKLAKAKGKELASGNKCIVS